MAAVSRSTAILDSTIRTADLEACTSGLVDSAGDVQVPPKYATANCHTHLDFSMAISPEDIFHVDMFDGDLSGFMPVTPVNPPPASDKSHSECYVDVDVDVEGDVALQASALRDEDAGQLMWSDGANGRYHASRADKKNRRTGHVLDGRGGEPAGTVKGEVVRVRD